MTNNLKQMEEQFLRGMNFFCRPFSCPKPISLVVMLFLSTFPLRSFDISNHNIKKMYISTFGVVRLLCGL